MRWVVVDGIDGSGKSTFATWVKESYEANGERVLVRVHPSPSWIGRRARRALEGEGKMLHLIATIFFILDVLASLRKLRQDSKGFDTMYMRYLMATAYLPTRLARWGMTSSPSFFHTEALGPGGRGPVVAHQRITERQHNREMFEDVNR
jgi:dTMP kinase